MTDQEFILYAERYMDNYTKNLTAGAADFYEYEAENKKDDDPISAALKNGLGNRRK